MTFQIGEKVVYPNQGIGTIESVSVRSFGTHTERYYLLRLLYSSMTVMVPFSHVADIGLRKITRNGELARVLNFLAEATPCCKQDWKHRYKENYDKMLTGGLFEIAEVLKNLLVLQRHKALSFREKRMLDRARHMLVTELSISRGFTEAEAEAMVRRALARASLALPPAM